MLKEGNPTKPKNTSEGVARLGLFVLAEDLNRELLGDVTPGAEPGNSVAFALWKTRTCVLGGLCWGTLYTAGHMFFLFLISN